MLYKRIVHSSYIYHHIIENMHDGVLTVDHSGTITTYNQAAEKILSMNKKDVLGKKFSDIFVHYPENDDFIQVVLDAVYESTMSHHKICNYFTGEDTKTLFVTTSFLKIKDSDECDTLGVAVVFSDITELQELRNAGVAMSKIKHLNKQLERLSYLDDLTGLPNRRYFNDIYRKEWRRAVRESDDLSLIMLDIDFFKQLNDTYGHQAGDECLAAIAQVLNKHMQRPGDMVSRYGGDEFTIILPRTDQQAAKRIAENLRLAVMELQISNPASPHGIVTISLGLADEKPSQTSHPDSLLKAADEALYRGKSKGRNFVSS